MTGLQHESAILFHNLENTTFLLDTPRSLALAQDWKPAPPHQNQDQWSSAQQTISARIEKSNGKSRKDEKKDDIKKKQHLLSSAPLTAPYPSSTEPKTKAARAKVLAKMAPRERRFHVECIQPLVRHGLDVIHAGYQSGERRWCLPRRVLPDKDREPPSEGVAGAIDIDISSVKKKRKYDGDIPCSSSLMDAVSSSRCPPVILSSTAANTFDSVLDLDGVVRNPSSETAVLMVGGEESKSESFSEYTVPPKSSFVLCTLPLSRPLLSPEEDPIPGMTSDQQFNLILLDPPWPNRSVRRSGHYSTQPYSEMSALTQRLRGILYVHSYDHTHDNAAYKQSTSMDNNAQTSGQSRQSIGAIWVTNAEKTRKAAYESLRDAGFHVCEEWVWIKTTCDGQPISELEGLWRKPYEMLVIGRKGQGGGGIDTTQTQTPTPSSEADWAGLYPAHTTKRVIAAVPDVHSRKPSLKEVMEKVFFMSSSGSVLEYSALEVFARNLTAGWWAVGNEVLKFNAQEWWVA
ncbi:MT-A70 family [Penicillium alfredii]|uniref:MT-A70 family n=1 Tax=Penicillium alfredii TaxID=1506179 RepID=A0A9W9FJV4_9EURO|nr:MT-A70 family [Penicillium alfredii]KAJ5101544.1 MT-A70 family [Penicillium alfredii]